MGNTFYQGVVLEKRRAESKAHKKNFEAVENFILIYSHLKTTLIVFMGDGRGRGEAAPVTSSSLATPYPHRVKDIMSD